MTRGFYFFHYPERAEKPNRETAGVISGFIPSYGTGKQKKQQPRPLFPGFAKKSRQHGPESHVLKQSCPMRVLRSVPPKSSVLCDH